MNKTTTTAATAGAAAGGIIAWGLSLIHGVDVPVEIGGLFSTVGAFCFGLIFPGD
jgi:hypothetical protein